MFSFFNVVRTSVYGIVVLFTGICLAMAGHFQHILASSDLTRFVPFSIFVCASSLFVITMLLGFSFFMKDRNPISTRTELLVLGLVGFFWFALGIFLAKSTSQSADVDCFDSIDMNDPLPDSAATPFHTEQYQAMYRVLNSFALINAFLVVLFCLGLLVLAMRRQRKGDEHMWHGPVTSCVWFNGNGKASVNRGGSKASNASILPFSRPGKDDKYRYRHKHNDDNDDEHDSRTKAPMRRSRIAGRLTPTIPASVRRAAAGRRADREKPLPPGPMTSQSRSEGGSSVGDSLSSNDFERGGMINPNARRHRSRGRQ